MQVLAGTSGYSYKEWKGPFYPEKLPADQMLRFYATRLRTVEINNTFYRMPAEAMLSHWAEEVPAGFAFSVKAPRRISHEKRLREAESDVAEFLRRASVLGEQARARSVPVAAVHEKGSRQTGRFPRRATGGSTSSRLRVSSSLVAGRLRV